MQPKAVLTLFWRRQWQPSMHIRRLVRMATATSATRQNMDICHLKIQFRLQLFAYITVKVYIFEKSMHLLVVNCEEINMNLCRKYVYATNRCWMCMQGDQTSYYVYLYRTLLNNRILFVVIVPSLKRCRAFPKCWTHELEGTEPKFNRSLIVGLHSYS